MNNELTLVSPWVDYYRQVEALFKEDPNIAVVFDEDNNVLKLYVKGIDKADALTQLLPTEKTFGKVTLKIEIIPANNSTSKIDLFRKAFEGNEALSYIYTISDISSNNFNYVVFKKEVVQYHNDSLGDPHGTCSTLYQEIAKNVFENSDGIYFSTDTE